LKKRHQNRKSRTLPRVFSKGHQAPLLIPENELEFFHDMVDHIGEEVIVADQGARIVFVNKAAVCGLGYTKEKILSRRLTDFLEDKISIKQWCDTYFSPVKSKRKPVSYTINRVLKGGKIRIVHMTVVHMSYGSKHYIVMIGRDITEQSVFEGKLKESEDRYRLLSEQAADGIIMIDPKGITLYANKAAGQMFKTTPEKLVGSHFEGHVSKSSLPLIWEYFNTVKSGVPIMHKELEIKNMKGQLVSVEFTASPIFRNGKIVQIHIIFRDVSEKKELEILIRESEKMEALHSR